MDINRKVLEYYSTQSISEQDIKSVIDCLNSSWLSQGPKIKEFEKKLGTLCNNNNVISTNSATSALHLAYKIVGVKKGSIVWTTPITFTATLNAAIQEGACVDFVDIDPKTLNLCPNLLEEKLKKVKDKRDLPDIVTTVHFAGNPCELNKIHKLSIEFGFKIIEDASHALGAYYDGNPIGQNKYSDASVFSFHPVKMITTGEGGALLLNNGVDQELAELLRSHGINRNRVYQEGEKISPWYYEQEVLGFNYRLSALQAALGISQLDYLANFIKTRRQLAQLYKKTLKGLPLKFQVSKPESLSSYHLFTIEILDNKFLRDNLFKFLKENKVGCQVHYIPLYRHHFYKKMGFSYSKFPNAERYFNNCLSIPLHQSLSKTDVLFVVSLIKKFFNQKI